MCVGSNSKYRYGHLSLSTTTTTAVWQTNKRSTNRLWALFSFFFFVCSFNFLRVLIKMLFLVWPFAWKRDRKKLKSIVKDRVEPIQHSEHSDYWHQSSGGYIVQFVYLSWIVNWCEHETHSLIQTASDCQCSDFFFLLERNSKLHNWIIIFSF